MFPFGGLLDGDLDDARVVGTQAVAGTSSNTPASLGAAAGDMAIVMSGAAVASGSGGAWNSTTFQPVTFVSWRTLTTPDLTAAITTSVSGFRVIIVRGASSMALVVTDSGTATSRTVAGFTRDANHAGLIAATGIRTATGGSINGALITAPATFTNYSGFGPFGSGGFDYQAYLNVRFAPPNAAYVNGASFTYNNGSGIAQFIQLNVFELRH